MNNDLISRSALKERLQARYDNGEEDFDKGYNIGLEAAIDLIDNAPTVPLPDFKAGYKQAIIDGKTNYSRPKGEWIKEDNGKTTDVYRCSICGRSIMLCKNADLSKYPFCHCGADMRGDTE